ncbi:ASCH domain-containing protein [Enterovibrio calviensis]|uniref:ASCH domain-containing protein n=1 Tax=Enterovibrio calviensis TaxID=91359 RepID=UPI0004885DDA|nr:ASCH domain-containing protein [Enterovibrio calviensis]
MELKHQQYLDKYLDTLPADVRAQHTSFSADYYCADEYNANVCANLILRGEKRASCSMAYWYRHQGELMPSVGHLQVVTYWAGDPVCIVEITSVSECRFKDVTEEFAASEGEGDKTLAWWRDAHWTFFSLECEELGITPCEDMMLILERFKVVYS